jgi:hypothetical protein
MKELARIVIYRALYELLSKSGDKWGDRVYPEQLPPDVKRPYVVVIFASGSRSWSTVAEDSDPIFIIKVVSTDLTDSLMLASRINELIDNSGKQESNRLVSGSQWQISATKRGLDVFLIDNSGSQTLYQCGSQYRFRLERII